MRSLGQDFHDPNFRGTSFASDLNASFERSSENPIYADRIGQGGFQLRKPLDKKKRQHITFRYSYSDTQITDLLILGLVPSNDLSVRLSTVSSTYTHVMSMDSRTSQAIAAIRPRPVICSSASIRIGGNGRPGKTASTARSGKIQRAGPRPCLTSD